MTADPYELRNLAPLPEYESHVAELDKILLSEVDYPEVAKTLLAENRANVARWMAGVGDRWEALMRNAYLDFDDDDLQKFKTWLAHGDAEEARKVSLEGDDEQCAKAGTGATGAWLASHPASQACGTHKDACESHCRANPRCRAWQWMAPSPDSTGSHTCYLKSEPGLAPNGQSTAAEFPRPPPPPPAPPAPPPPPWASRASLLRAGTRPVVRYGYGNELCYQSLNDSALTKAVAESGGTISRYPGGTPSDYWHWDTGWATDLGNYQGPRRATPADWGAYVQASGTEFTVFDTNQLTTNLSYAIEGLKAHQAAGSTIKYVELGNEMYDDSRADVVSTYPNGSAYAEKMAGWTKAIKAAFPKAQVALIGDRWNAYRKPREDNWNKQVLQNPLSSQADAATFHIYCPLDETNNSSEPTNVAKHLATAFFRAAQNKQHVAEQVPARLRLWVTEMGVYPAGPLLWTWLEALFYVLLDLLLPDISQLDVLTPYCLVCGDPTASSFITASETSVVPPAQAGKVPWLHSLAGHAQSIIFKAAKGAGTMTPLAFSHNKALDPSVANSRALVGWRFGKQTVVLVNAGAAEVDVDLDDLVGAAGGCTFSGSFPKAGAADITRAGMMVTELGVLQGSCGAAPLKLPGYALVSIALGPDLGQQ